MCLSVVARIDKILENGEAVVELGNVRKTISLGLIANEVTIGDWVLVHTGFAISVIDEEKAMEILAAYEVADNMGLY